MNPEVACVFFLDGGNEKDGSEKKMPLNEQPPADCICKDCMPTPSYWNGIDPEWHRIEMDRRTAPDPFDEPYDGDAADQNDP